MNLGRTYVGYVGVSGATAEARWTSTDALLYAVAVGAGKGDPTKELEFTTENTTGVTQRVLPSMICVVGYAPRPEGLKFDLTRMLHAEMGFELFRELAPEGRVRSTQTITGVYDKGSGALVTATNRVVDAETEELVATLTSGMFLRGEGNFGGDRGPANDWSTGEREPDVRVVYATLPEQTLIYRLTGDRNRLHSDPKHARRSGFPRPILHGMCTYGFTARALLHEVAGSDPARFRSMYGRLSKPVFPGDTLTVEIWKNGAGALFRTINNSGDVVIDRGRMMTVGSTS